MQRIARGHWGAELQRREGSNRLGGNKDEFQQLLDGNYVQAQPPVQKVAGACEEGRHLCHHFQSKGNMRGTSESGTKEEAESPSFTSEQEGPCNWNIHSRNMFS